MHNLGQTRSSQQPNHLLLTADTFVRTPLPGMKSCTAIVHAGPAIGAKFAQYTAEFEAAANWVTQPAQRFVFVMEGAARSWKLSGKQKRIGGRGAMLICPKERGTASLPRRTSRVIVIEKPYQALASVEPPRVIVSSEDASLPIRLEMIPTCR